MSKETDKLNARINELEIENKLMKELLANNKLPSGPPLRYSQDYIDDMFHRSNYVSTNQKYSSGHEPSTSVNLGDAPACGKNLDDLGTKPISMGGQHSISSVNSDIAAALNEFKAGTGPT